MTTPKSFHEIMSEAREMDNIDKVNLMLINWIWQNKISLFVIQVMERKVIDFIQFDKKYA